MELRKKAIAHFRENYETTILSFIPPQDLILDDTGQNLPISLLLSIIALTSKFVAHPCTLVAFQANHLHSGSFQNLRLTAHTHLQSAVALQTQHVENSTATTKNLILQQFRLVSSFAFTKLDMERSIKVGSVLDMLSASPRLCSYTSSTLTRLTLIGEAHRGLLNH